MSCSAIPHWTNRSGIRELERPRAAVGGEVGVEDDQVGVAPRPARAASRRRPRRRTRRVAEARSRARRRRTPARPRGRRRAPRPRPARAQAASSPSAAHRSARRSSSSATARANGSSAGAPACQRYVPPPSASAAGCSMNETPFPFTVSRDERLRARRRRLGSCRRRPAARRGRDRRTVTTSQPNARSFASRSPSATISSVGLSDCTSFRSTTTHSLPSRSWAAAWSASQFWPSCSSPSPVITTTRPPRPRRRFASAIPRPFEMPIPSEPEFASIPGTPTSGCPSSPPRRRRRSRRSCGIDAEREERGVQPRDVVALGREEDVTVGIVESALGDVQLVEQEVRDDVERAERRAEMARARALHRDERVQPARIRERARASRRDRRRPRAGDRARASGRGAGPASPTGDRSRRATRPQAERRPKTPAVASRTKAGTTGTEYSATA